MQNRISHISVSAAICLAIATAAARGNYSQDFNTGAAAFTVNDPYWLNPNAANGFITQTTNTPAIWPGNPAGFGADINQDVSGNGFFLFEGTALYPNGGSSGGNIPPGQNQFFISPIFSVTANTNYTVSFYLTNADVLSSLPSVQPEIGGSLLGSPVSPVGTWSSNGWQQFSYTWNSGSNTTASLVLHDFTQAVSGNDFGIDNISVTGVPEPSSAMLLGAGAVGFGVLSRRLRAARSRPCRKA